MGDTKKQWAPRFAGCSCMQQRMPCILMFKRKSSQKRLLFSVTGKGGKRAGCQWKDAEGKVHLQEEDVHTGHLMHMTEERWPLHIESEPHEGEGEMLRFREEDGENLR